MDPSPQTEASKYRSPLEGTRLLGKITETVEKQGEKAMKTLFLDTEVIIKKCLLVKWGSVSTEVNSIGYNLLKV